MKNKYFLLGIVSTILLIFSGCAVKIKNFEDYSSIGAGKAPLAPPPHQIKTNQVKVVLYNIEDKTTNNQKSAVSNLSATLIRTALLKTNVAIIDRSAIEKFSDEAILTATETGKETSISAAQYAIKGQIDNYVGYSSYQAGYVEKIAGYTTTNADGSITVAPDQSIYHPPLCNYTGEMAGRFEIYTLPSLELVMDIPLKGVGNKSVRASESGAGLAASLIDNSLLSFGVWAIASSQLDSKCRDKNVEASVISTAVQKSLAKKEEKKLLNQFAAKGYVSDIRKRKNKYIIQITIGSQNGVNQNNYLNVYRQFNITDALSGESKIENKKTAEARASQLTESNSAWLVVKDKKEASKILIGDLVKVIY